MSNNGDRDINDLAATADALIKSRADAQSKSSNTKKRILAKSSVMLLLVVVFASIFYIQYPKIVDPFDAITLQAPEESYSQDLMAIAQQIFIYHMATGRYPETLTEVNMPESLAEISQRYQVVYLNQQNNFALTMGAEGYEFEYLSSRNQVITSKTDS
ncbi:hypothetical protein QP938_02445 [Porticoccaceae bacterium LTM1]|nr:hypothetical protein QP938_02445 [Porticoccaceae bacterium LTM1]